MSKKEEIEYLKSIQCSLESDILNSSINVIMDYIITFNKDKLFKSILINRCKDFNTTSFNKIRSGSLFSVLLYSTFTKGLKTDYIDAIFRISTYIKGGLDMVMRRFKNYVYKFTISDIHNILTHGNIKDMRILIKNTFFIEADQLGKEILLFYIFKNDIKILDYFLDIERIITKLRIPHEIKTIIWDNTIYSKIFNAEMVKHIFETSVSFPYYTKKLKLLYECGILNIETLHHSKLSLKMIQNFSTCTQIPIFCKYNNFTESTNSSPPLRNELICHKLLRSMKLNKYYVTISLSPLERSVVRDLYPPIPLEHNHKLEYSIKNVGGTDIYIVTDYYAPGDLKTRMDSLTRFHTWARDFESAERRSQPKNHLQNEMDAMEQYIKENKGKKLWWPQRYIRNYMDQDQVFYPKTCYENDGWLYVDNHDLNFVFNSKYSYFYHNTNWVHDEKIKILNPNKFEPILVSESKLRSDSIPDGLWKCEWIDNFELDSQSIGPCDISYGSIYNPIQLMDNKYTIQNMWYLDIIKMLKQYNDIVIPYDIKARNKVNPSEYLLTNELKFSENSTYIGCGMDYIKDCKNYDINPFYSTHDTWNINIWKGDIIIKYSDWMLDTQEHFVEFLKNVNKCSKLYLVIIDADLFSDKFYFEDGSYIEKVNDENSWSCDVYKVKGFLNWIHPLPGEYTFYIATTKFFENNLSDWKNLYGYTHSPIVGTVFEKINKNSNPTIFSLW